LFLEVLSAFVGIAVLAATYRARVQHRTGIRYASEALHACPAA